MALLLFWNMMLSHIVSLHLEEIVRPYHLWHHIVQGGGGWAEKVMAIKTIYGLPIFLVVQESINRHHNKLVLPHFADCCIACWLAVQVLPRWSSWYSASIESMYSVLYLCWVTSYHRCDSSCLGGQQMPHWPTTWLTLYCPPQVSVADSWSLKDTLLCIITNFL
jgi:hypothetical protein